MSTCSTAPLRIGLVNRLSTTCQPTSKKSCGNHYTLWDSTEIQLMRLTLNCKKKYFCFWLKYYWCAWEKIYIFVSVYTTTAQDLEKIQSTLESRPPSKIIFVSDYSTTTMGLGKNLIRLDPHRKKIWLQYYYGTWDLDKTQMALDPLPKQKYILFPATVLAW